MTMKINEKDIKALDCLRLRHYYEGMDYYNLLLELDGEFKFAVFKLYHLGKIHGIRQERARRRKSSPATNQSKQGKNK